MVTLKGKQCYLRALEPEDLEFVFQIENNEDNWPRQLPEDLHIGIGGCLGEKLALKPFQNDHHYRHQN